MSVLGSDIGGTMIKTALIHQTGNTYKKRFPTPKKKEELFLQFKEKI